MRFMFALVFLLFSAFQASAEVRTRIIDTGPGLATVTRFPDGSIMVFDTGHWTYQGKVFREFQDFIGDDDIDLLVVSHGDGDHLSATDELFQEYRIHRVLRTGQERDGTNWKNHDKAIRDAAAVGSTHDMNLAEVQVPHGTTFRFGAATVTYLAGFHEPPASWGLTDGEYLNGNSIVLRVSYRGRAILFTGDAVGRKERSAQNSPAIATEKFLISNAAIRPIDSDVLIAAHHGGDDASSEQFINEVTPAWVIFSAGHKHGHPMASTAERFIDAGISPECLLRTDRGDNEGGAEWSYGSTGVRDIVGDDSIDIVVSSSGSVSVKYSDSPPVSCPSRELADETDIAVVRKSRSGICHTETSPWYERTLHYEAFDSLEVCLASGGRTPK